MATRRAQALADSKAPSAGRPGATVLALASASGAIALVYECLWVREFTALFGATAPAAAATVSAMFSGFALGSAWFGKRAHRWSRPLAVYGLLEIGAGACSLAVMGLDGPFASIEPWLHAQLGNRPAALFACRVAQVVVALLPATFLLGGTLPVLTHVGDEQRGRGGVDCSLLYSVNTAGAVIGALAVPFVLLPNFGATRSWLGAACAGLAIGSFAWWIERLRAPRPMAAAVGPIGPPTPGVPAPRGSLALTRLAFASGLLTLGLEANFGRMLTQVHHNSVHAFAIVLALFLACLAAGAAVGTRWADRGAGPETLERAWIAAGLLGLLAPEVFVRVTGGLEYLEASSWSGYAGKLLGVCVLSFGPATVCAGTVLPVLLARSVRVRGPAAADVGRVLAANTLGSVVGPLLATFVLFPLVGLWGSAVSHALAFLGLACYAARLRGARLAPLWLLIPGAAAVCLLSSRVVRLPRVRWDAGRGEELVWIREGSHGIASVVRHGGGLRMKLDNTYTLGGSGTSGDALQVGHIPLLLHPAPRRVAVVGLGTGITASAALLHDVDRLVVFELVPEVVAGAREPFATRNGQLLDDPKVELVLGDARGHLRASGREYDVIISDLVVPWRRGESSLHTREHFLNVRRALAPRGLFCQWLPLFQMTEEQFRIVAATFLDAFPSAMLWRSDFVAALPALGLVGQEHEGALDSAAIDERTRALAAVLSAQNRYMAHPAGLWLHLVGSIDASVAWVRSAPRNTMDMPWLELHSAQTQVTRAPFVGERLLRFLDELQRRPLAGALRGLDARHRSWRQLGLDLFRASSLAEAGASEVARGLAFDALERLPQEIQVEIRSAR